MLFEYVTLIPATTRRLTNSQAVAHLFFLFFRRHNSINRAQTLIYTVKLSKENKNYQPTTSQNLKSGSVTFLSFSRSRSPTLPSDPAASLRCLQGKATGNPR